MLGGIAAFWRDSPGGWQGHVDFLIGEDAEACHVLGGNQSDSVNISGQLAASQLAE